MTAPSSAPAGSRTSFVVVDNHEVVLESIAQRVVQHPDLDLVGQFATVPEPTLPAPDVVVLDLYLGRDDTPSTDAIPGLVARGSRVLLHTSAEFPVPVRQAVAAGAAGLSLKNDGLAALFEAIRTVAAGDFACSSTVAHALLGDPDLAAKLTSRELEVVESVHDGLTHREIARRFGIAEETARDHLKAVRRKYVALGRQVTNAHSIVREAQRDGWLPPPR